MLTLEVKERATGETADTLREGGFVPAVVYGGKEASRSLAVDGRKLEQVWKTAGRTSLVRLSGSGDEKDTLIKDIQLHPVTGRILHADFYALEKGKKIQIAVPLEFVGESPAEKAGNVIVKSLHQIEIEVAPHELPHSLAVDLSLLKEAGDHISASDVVLPKSATLVTHGEEVVASATVFVEEKAPAPEAATAADASAAGGEGESTGAPAEQSATA